MKELGIDFPVILKPDRGERGYNVEVIRSREDLEVYLRQSSDGLMLQEFIDAREEVGVMYCRTAAGDDDQIPSQELTPSGVTKPTERSNSSGEITSIVHKVKMSVTGDGKTTLGELIASDRRCRRHRKWLYSDWKEKLDWIPPRGELVTLNTYGNHSRGAIFTDGSRLNSDSLLRRFNDIVSNIDGFDVGRFDVLLDSVDDLETGNFKIIELNGVNSEPGHIYDPDNTLIKAYRDLLIHWNTVSRVAQKNIQQGVRPDRLSEVIASIQQHFERKKRLKVSLV
jgi:hypothetical protein